MKGFRIRFTRGRLIAGLIIGCGIAVAGALFSTLKAGVLLGLMAVLLSGFTLETERLDWLLTGLWGVGSTLWMMEVTQLCADSIVEAWQLQPRILGLGMLLHLCFILLLYVITGRIKVSVMVTAAYTFLISLVNGYVIRFQGNQFELVDLLKAGTAANVAAEYTFEPTNAQNLGIALFLILMLSAGCFREPSGRKGLRRLIALPVLAAALAVMIPTMTGFPTAKFINDGANKNGYVLNAHCRAIELASYTRPEKYSAQLIDGIAEETAAAYRRDTSAEELPTIIAIMNESYADLSVLGRDIPTEEPVTPYFDSLRENTIRGRALSSIFGGNTANSEWEFLSGGTMAFFQDNTIIFQSHFNGPQYSIVSDLSSLGYECIATHPFRADSWARQTAWKLLGFDKLEFIDAYADSAVLRKFVSDRAMYEHINELYESRDRSKPMFLFGVTIQNHGGYQPTDEFESPRIGILDEKLSSADAEVYLGLLRESDKALEYLIDTFSQKKEKVVIVFFGDHLPKLEGQIVTPTGNTLTDREKRYTVPFFVWANYDIEEEEIPLTSLNYLTEYVYQAAGIDKPEYMAAREKIREAIPAVNAFGYYSAADQTFRGLEEASGEEKELLDTYSCLQYNMMTDIDHRSRYLFPVADAE